MINVIAWLPVMVNVITWLPVKIHS